MYLDTSQDYAEFIQSLPNISVKDRASKAKKILRPLEKSTNELKAYTPSLSLHTPEEQEVARAWKDAIGNAMMCRVESLKLLSLDRELTMEEKDNLLDYAKKNLDYYMEAVKQGDKLDAFIK